LLASSCTKVTPVIIIVLLATTSRHDMHSASYVFGSDGIVNQTNGWNNGLAFLFGLLSVQWTVCGIFDLKFLRKIDESFFLDDGMFQSALIRHFNRLNEKQDYDATAHISYET